MLTSVLVVVTGVLVAPVAYDFVMIVYVYVPAVRPVLESSCKKNLAPAYPADAVVIRMIPPAVTPRAVSADVSGA